MQDEYQKTLEMFNKLRAQQEEEMNAVREQEVNNAKENFLKLVNFSNSPDATYRSYEQTVESDVRNNIFDQLSKFYSDENVVTDDVLYAFKKLLLNMLQTSKKYKSSVEDLVLTETESNMLVEHNKGVFRVYVRDNNNEKVPPRHVCYVKNNGDNYYLTG